jgi:hypothetical protein
MPTDKLLKVREIPKKPRENNFTTLAKLEIPPFLNLRIQINPKTQEVRIYMANGAGYVMQVLDPETDTQDLNLIADTILGAISKIDWYREMKATDNTAENE